jgi:hypothetical protein
MKTIARINLFAICLPVFILVFGSFFYTGAIAFAMLSTILTGAIQIILSIILALKTNGNPQIYRYISFVAIYFMMLYAQTFFGSLPFTKNAVFEQIYFGLAVTVPLALAIYFTKIVYDLEGEER